MQKFYKYVSWISVFILASFLLIYIFKDLCIFGSDDLNTTYDSFSLSFEENGRYVCNILSRIFCLYIPNLLNIHLQDAVNTIGLAALVIIILLLSSISAFFVFLKDKSESVFVYDILFIVAIFHFIYYISNYCAVYYLELAFQYGYILASFFGFVFLYFLFDYFINNNYDLSKKKIILFTLAGFCAGNSTHMITYVCSVSIVLFYVYTIIEKSRFCSILPAKSGIKEILFNKKIIIPVSAFILGAILMVSCQGFWASISWRRAESLSQIFDILIPFSKEFFHIVFANKAAYYITICILILMNVVKNFIQTKQIKPALRITVYSITPLIGVWLYYFSLITLGPTFPTSSLFWVYEPFYDMPHIMILSLVFCFLIGYFFQNIKDLKIKIIIIFLLCVSAFSGEKMYFIKNIKYIINQKKEEVTQTRKIMYTCDKIALTQFYNDEKIVLPSYCKYNIFLYSTKDRSTRYFKSVYNIQLNEEIIFTDKIHSLDEFITKEEENLNFTLMLKNISKK